MCRPLLILLLLALAAPVHGDILHLRGGVRYTGELVSRDNAVVVFRVQLPGGRSSIARTFPAALVVRVEVTGGADASAGLTPGVADTAPAGENVEQMLREAWELVDDGDWRAGLRAAQRAVQRATEPQLERLGVISLAERGIALDEFLAVTRIATAAAFDGDTFRIPYATQYERAALGRLLARYQRDLLSSSIDGRALADWLASTEAYEELRPGARVLAGTAARCAATIDARLKLDPQLADDRAKRQMFVRQRDALVRLAGEIRALRGFTTGYADEGQRAPAEVARDLATRLLALPDQDEAAGSAAPASQPTATRATEEQDP